MKSSRPCDLLLVLALQTGLRVSELINLSCGDIALGAGAHVRCMGKGRKERVTPVRKDSVKVLRLVVWSALRLALAGAAIGLVAALFLRQLVDGLLFAISPSDPATLTGAIVVTTGAVIASSLLPAWRATNISPVETLR